MASFAILLAPNDFHITVVHTTVLENRAGDNQDKHIRSTKQRTMLNLEQTRTASARG